MQLFGKDIIIDSRRLTAFARDISLVDEDEYRRFKAPTSISKFEDLRNYDLEYAGIYEDLWFSDSAFVVLKSRKTDKVFNFAGVVPNIGNPNFSTRLTISIGKTKRTFPLKVGEFLVTVPVRSGETTQRVSFSFDSYQHLPFGDDRPVTLKLHYLGFSENPGESVQ